MSRPLRLLISLLLVIGVVSPASAADLAPAGEAAPFSDVAADDVFLEAITWLADQGITKGCNPPDNTLFCPDEAVSRGQMAAFLTRALELPAGTASFTDALGSVFEADIAALATAGITKGCNPPDNTLFCPDNNVTRGQMAAFLTRALELPSGTASFTDTIGSVFEADIAALAAAGITKGCNPPDNTLFCPDNNVTRGQMAAFLYRALQEDPTPPPPPPSPLIDTTSLPAATVGADYSTTLAASDGTPPYVWTATGLPNGLSLDPDAGTITGIATDTGSSDVAITVTDTNAKTAEKTLPLVVNAAAGCEANAAIPDLECAALVAVYDSTHGDLWTDTTNWLTGDPCSWFGVGCAAGHVVELGLSTNAVSGTLPTEIGYLTGLHWLYLGGNAIEGTIPDELGDIAVLEELILSDNEFTGPIPESLGDLTELSDLQLAANNFSGELPSALANLPKLVDLIAFDNALSGAIPAGFGNLTTLQTLDLGENQFTGPIPPDIATSDSLVRLRLDNNLLEGPVPDGVTMMPALLTLELQGNGCFVATPPTATWLDSNSPNWDDGCP